MAKNSESDAGSKIIAVREMCGTKAGAGEDMKALGALLMRLSST